MDVEIAVKELSDARQVYGMAVLVGDKEAVATMVVLNISLSKENINGFISVEAE